MSIRKGRTRQRVQPLASSGQLLVGSFYKKNLQGLWDLDPPQQVALPQFDWVSFERVGDENHGRPPYHIGGPFKKIRVVACEPPEGAVFQEGVWVTKDGSRKYVGGFRAPTQHFGTMPGFCTPADPEAVKDRSFPDLTDIAARVWNKAKPKIQKANAFGAIAEAGDIPRTLQKTGRRLKEIYEAMGGNKKSPIMSPKKVADDFLNGQFGWIPFLNDVADFYQTYRDQDDYIRKLTRDNGQSRRRRAVIGPNRTKSLISTGSGQLFSTILFDRITFFDGNVQANWSLEEELEQTTWGVGKFRYYREEFDAGKPGYHSKMAEMRRLQSLYGARISPSNVYNIIPWSWAIDWFTNARQYIDRASDWLMDGIAAEYFYIMHHEKRTRVLKNTYPFHKGRVTLEARRTVETKQRVEATSPYGISLSWDQLTPRQLAIAGALGITRM